jgi:tripartite-type tricarboxylate transporter receptor subunit TctC
MRNDTWMARSVFLLAALFAVAAPAAAQEYPTKPVRIVVGFGAGGASDISARLVAQKLSERLGQQFLIENRPSAGGIVAAELVARAQPDGYTLLLIAANNAISTSLFKKLPYDLVADFAPVSTLAYFSFAFVTRNDSMIRSIADLVAAGKGPKKPSVGTTAIGGGQYLTAELFKSMSGADLLTVPFNSTPAALTALRSGDVDLVVENLPPVYGPVRSGDLTALAVTSRQRFPGLPRVPTVAEGGLAGFEADTWNAIVAPARTPEAVIGRLGREINAVLAEPDLRQKFVELGLEARGSTPAALRDHVRAEIEKWRAVIEKAKIEKQ